MLPKKKEHPKQKTELHPRNKHRLRYDFKALIGVMPELAPFVRSNPYGDLSIDFFNAEAVKTLNRALLKQYYNINNWNIPAANLCPPIPGRADYIHHIADLLGSKPANSIPHGSQIKCLDIGVGASCIYPIIGNKEYGWHFVGSDTDQAAVNSANKIIEANPEIKSAIEIRLQKKVKDIFTGIIQKEELFDLTICNPPFHSSLEDAQSGTLRKLSNLKNKIITKPDLNFGGKNNELWCEGGEAGFVSNMIHQSKMFSDSVFWFSSLVSKQSNLNDIYSELLKVNAFEVKTIPMGQGNKISRIVAWTFLNKEKQLEWIMKRWK
jgi:23S rRNA (adenine1618-N6)-methyltransferase